HARFGVQKNPAKRQMFKAEELKGTRVLVVDDNASAREILSTMAQGFGLEVDVARDGVEGLQLLADSDRKALPYDLVLMDWKMPVMDGVETVRQMHEQALGKVPAVVMVTAFGREEAMTSAQERGVQVANVLPKPVTASTLLEAIGETLHRGVEIVTRSEERVEHRNESIASLKGCRILLVEDNEMNQELALELLGNAGIDVTLAENGQIAVDKVQTQGPFDGVLMDCQMPVMDGYTATREIRKLAQFKDLPIIAMTANAMAGDKEKVLAAGMWDHISKPLDVHAMFNTMAKWIKPSAPAKARSAAGPHAVAVPSAGDAEQSVAQTSITTRAGSTFDPKSNVSMATANPFAALVGIDVKAGLATTMDNPKLYTRLLNKFKDSQAGFADLFAQALLDADATAPARVAHTLKGTAGNIGARQVQAAAGELEHACLDNAPEAVVQAALAEVLAQLTPVIQGLRVFAGDEPIPSDVATPKAAPAAFVAAPASQDAPGPTAATTHPEWDAGLSKLETLLADSDVEAMDVLDELQDMANGHQQRDALKRVARAVEAFDFDAALDALQKARGVIHG
ncbi:MAG TPA: response regulator, partial [Burkholderiaceae bacterium]|nr:response regulator [Burkholderiaceae bacterium]